MPVYDQSYRTFKGGARSHGRWWAIVEHELRVFLTPRSVLVVLALALPTFLLYVFQVLAYDLLSNPTQPTRSR